MSKTEKKLKNAERQLTELIEIMEKLLSPEGCPWDRAQTPRSLAPHAIEEAHELVEALEREDVEGIKEELGDLLLQVIFHSALAQRRNQFTLEDVLEGICKKLVSRHTHVFGDVKAKTAEDALINWTAMKNKEKSRRPKEGRLGVPLSLPALQRAQKIGDKTRTLKFDWQAPQEVFDKVEEEFIELKTALDSGDVKHAEEELGDLFFVLAQWARHMKWDAETVCRKGNRKFEARFDKLLTLAEKRNLNFSSLSIEEKEKLWEEVKA